MTRSWTDIPVSRGTWASERLAPGHLPDGAGVLRGLPAEHLARLATNARQPWKELFRREPLILCAELIAFDEDKTRHSFDIALERNPKEAADQVSHLSKMMLLWLDRITDILPGPFAETLLQLDRELHVHPRVSGLAALSPEDILSNAAGTMAFRRANSVFANEQPVEGSVSLPGLIEARGRFDALVDAHRFLIHIAESLKPGAVHAYAEIVKSEEIDPAIGLIIGELAATEHVEKRLNRFPARHATFYFRDIIGQTRRPGQREAVLLHIPPSPRSIVLPIGTSLTARGPNGEAQSYQTVAAVPVSPSVVKATGILTHQTNREISLYSALGAITRVSAALEPADDSIPLKRRVFSAPLEGHADIGLNIASPMFSLAEGTRKVEVSLVMRRATSLPAANDTVPAKPEAPDPAVDVELRADPELVEACGFRSLDEGVAALSFAVKKRAAELGRSPSMALIYETVANFVLGPRALRILLGRIVTITLIEGAPLPSGAYWNLIQTKIRAMREDLGGLALGDLGTETDSMVFEAFARSPDNTDFIFTPADIFQKLLGDAFDLQLVGEDGAVSSDVSLVEGAGRHGHAGLTLTLGFEPVCAPIVGGENDVPVLHIRYNAKARVCPVSFFERYAVGTVRIAVSADGLRSLQGFNVDGPVAPDQSFLPFGSRPIDGAALIVAAPEMAAKPVTEIHVDMDWAEVPKGLGGFDATLTGYPDGTPVPDPRVRLSYLSGDGWKDTTPGPMLPLLERDNDSGAFKKDWHYKGHVDGRSLPAAGAMPGDAPAVSRSGLRAGAVRLELTGSAGGFGLDAYPLALAQAMRPPPLNLPLPPRPVPQAPWLPKVKSLALGYKAETIIELSAPQSARPGEKVTQITPFGRIECFPARAHRPTRLFAPRLGLATLFVQIAGQGRRRPLGLLFDIADNGHERIQTSFSQPFWHYLSEEGWKRLPNTAISSDTTDGLMRSGVVTLDLPQDATDRSSEMPEGGVWIAASVDRHGQDCTPILSSVRTNGVWAENTSEGQLSADKADVTWALQPPVAGLATPREVARRAPPRAVEDRASYLARVAGRLRHRQRALTPWDIENLILQEFTEVFAAKCLPHLNRHSPTPLPGYATVIVLRHPSSDQAFNNPQPQLFDAGTLHRIEDYLSGLKAPFAQISVENPSFDRLMVRARIRVRALVDDGALSRKMQGFLAKRLSVWSAPPDLARFGWTLNAETVRAEMADFADVDAVTDFSILKLSANDQDIYSLDDTARAQMSDQNRQMLRPSRPWALPLSVAEHTLTEITHKTPIVETPSGIGRLRVGDMLVVGQEN